MRFAYIAAGLICVGLGWVGYIVPGMPGTVFFVMATWCFSRSSPRLEQWVINLPGIGQLVDDYRQGNGMPLRAKVIAITSITVMVSFSVFWRIKIPAVQVIVLLTGLIGIWYIGFRVPTATPTGSSATPR